MKSVMKKKQNMRVKMSKNNLMKFIRILEYKINNHKDAYSLDIFPNSEKLDENSTRDSISAKMGRHMCDCFFQYINEALEELENE